VADAAIQGYKDTGYYLPVVFAVLLVPAQPVSLEYSAKLDSSAYFAEAAMKIDGQYGHLVHLAVGLSKRLRWETYLDHRHYLRLQ